MNDMLYIDAHTHKISGNDNAVVMLNLRYPPVTSGNLSYDRSKVFISSGIHPWQLVDTSERELNNLLVSLEKAAATGMIDAIGECGIDRAIKTDYILQEKFFIRQIEIAEHFKLPVIIHCVRAYSELISITKQNKSTTYWLIHHFSGNTQQLQQLLKYNNFLFSFGKSIINAPAKYRELMQLALPERLLLETDDEEIDIKTIYKHAAEILDITVEELADNICTAWNKLV